MNSSRFELVAKSVDKRDLRTDSHQRDLLLLTASTQNYVVFAERDNLIVLLFADSNVGALFQTSSTSVPRCHKHMLHFLALSQLPGNCMLSATSTNYKNVRHFP